MRIDVLSLTSDTVKFILSGRGTAFANALRRAMIAEVPCMVIDDLFMFDNSSPLPDEILAHRVGLIPLTTDLDGFVLPERCDCKSDLGCGKCRVILTLDAAAGGERRAVYSGDLVSEDPRVRPSSPDILLVKLAPGQAVRFEAYARLGRGKSHAKWQPVSMSVYQQLEKAEAAALRGGEGGAEAPDGEDFLFSVESTGCIPPERIVTEAARVLIEKLEEFSGKLRRGETAEELVEFEFAEEIGKGLYRLGPMEHEEEEEEGGG